jgi:hypothetical protein
LALLRHNRTQNCASAVRTFGGRPQSALALVLSVRAP